ncbi:unnamed protein product [Tetraodon nigroviridis]|uniref:(spotted green pufferfish) hypothetical protein n=1 Tax=Tetraodon nigroviridis TaxID=99883 RepID=Q4SBQ6_TETNG|nr:unnamed protein product [Tetraodon nigroviridis]
MRRVAVATELSPVLKLWRASEDGFRCCFFFQWTWRSPFCPPLCARPLHLQRSPVPPALQPGGGGHPTGSDNQRVATMSVAGLKKQFHKATQKVSEKVGGAEGTKLDDDFTEMEKASLVDVTSRAVLDIMTKTTEYLQPNPATRAKMSMMNSMSRMRGQEKGPGYTQTEAILGESMQKFGRELGEESSFGEVKDALDMEVKQNFIDPLQNLHEKDLKEIQVGRRRGRIERLLWEDSLFTCFGRLLQHHLKKLEGRRLDFDYKKKRQAKVTEDELKQALEKFDDSKEIAEQSMFNLLESDIEQVSQLAALVQAQLEYHSRSAEILTQLSSKIDERIREASGKPRKEFVPKPRTSLDFSISENHNGGIHGARSPARSPGEISEPPEMRYLSITPNVFFSPVIRAFSFVSHKQVASSLCCRELRPTETLNEGRAFSIRSTSRSPAPMDQPCCRALYDFDPENDGELGFKEGDIITLTNKIDDNWFEGMLHGNSGFFPINYVDTLVPLPH